MFVTNTTGDYIYLRGIALPPGISVDVPNEHYLGNEDIREKLNSLYEQDRIHVNDPDELINFPVLDETDELPTSFYVDEDSMEIQNDDITSIVGLEYTEDGKSFGVIELHSTTESTLKLRGASLEDGEGMVELDKDSNEDGKPFSVKINGLKLLLDPDTASASDIADVLVTLGLVEEA